MNPGDCFRRSVRKLLENFSDFKTFLHAYVQKQDSDEIIPDPKPYLSGLKNSDIYYIYTIPPFAYIKVVDVDTVTTSDQQLTVHQAHR
jgi:hypothetical protein